MCTTAKVELVLPLATSSPWWRHQKLSWCCHWLLHPHDDVIKSWAGVATGYFIPMMTSSKVELVLPLATSSPWWRHQKLSWCFHWLLHPHDDVIKNFLRWLQMLVEFITPIVQKLHSIQTYFLKTQQTRSFYIIPFYDNWFVIFFIYL